MKAEDEKYGHGFTDWMKFNEKLMSKAEEFRKNYKPKTERPYSGWVEELMEAYHKQEFKKQVESVKGEDSNYPLGKYLHGKRYKQTRTQGFIAGWNAFKQQLINKI